MSGVQRILVTALVVVGLATLSLQQATAQSTSTTAKATEIGVTPSEIHIAVIADVDNPFAPGLFQGAVDGVRGARIPQQQGGRRRDRGSQAAGRLHRFAPEHQRDTERVITACQHDFAMVGTCVAVPVECRPTGQLQGPGGPPDRFPDIAGRHDRGPAVVLTGRVPGVPRDNSCAAQRRFAADVQREPGRHEVPVEAPPERSPRPRSSRRTTARTPPWRRGADQCCHPGRHQGRPAPRPGQVATPRAPSPRSSIR